MTATIITAVAATLFTLINWSIALHWRAKIREAKKWYDFAYRVESRQRNTGEHRSPWDSGYLNGVRHSGDIFRKQFDRAKRDEVKGGVRHDCHWRVRMFAAKQALEHEVERMEPKEKE